MKLKNAPSRNTSLLFLGLCLLLILEMSSCSDRSYDRGPFAIGDEELKPYAAMYQVDRERVCLTEIDEDAEVKIWRSDRESRGYDVVLLMEGREVSRSVYFAQENGQYIWVGEQETHYSGRDYISLDGELPEKITITYFERTTEGGFVGLDITYWGNPSVMPLTCEAAQRYIREWDERRMGSDKGSND